MSTTIELREDASKTWLMSAIAKAKPLGVDRKAGIIYGAAIVTEGEAKGHGVNLDSEFVQNVAELGNEKSLGVKVRFGHPNMSSTALGTFLGRVKSFAATKLDSGLSITRGDIHLDETAKETPNGNLFDYVLNMAEKNPDMFGTSIVFSRGDIYRRDEKGAKVKYPRMGNAEERKAWDECKPKEFIEINKLHAADVVDEPAANNGLFSAWSADTWAGQMTEFLDTHPHLLELLESKPETMQKFLERYNDYRHRAGRPVLILSTTNTTGVVGEPKQPVTEEEKQMADASKPEATPSAPAPVAAPAAPAAPQLSEGEKVKAQLKRFTDTFGAVDGVAYFQEGITFEEAQSRHIAKLSKQNEELNKKLEGAKFGAPAPVSAPSAEAKPKAEKPEAKKFAKGSLAPFIRIAGQPQAVSN